MAGIFTSIESATLNSMLVILSTILVIGIAMIMVHPVNGHTFSQNENSLFLTRMDQMHSQLQLVQDLLSTNNTSGDNNVNNFKLAQTHAIEGLALLMEKDHVSNFT